MKEKRYAELFRELSVGARQQVVHIFPLWSGE